MGDGEGQRGLMCYSPRGAQTAKYGLVAEEQQHFS